MSACRQCGYCCEYLDYPISKGVLPDEIAARFLEARGGVVMHNGLWWAARFYLPCPHLTPQKKCDLWPNIPEACRLSPNPAMARTYPACAHKE